ncbi:polysaccharide biosynthesis/export family protein (plasmid) [Roseobacteraceae bacterium NS-SX3]
MKLKADPMRMVFRTLISLVFFMLPAAAALAQSGYKISPGDALRIEVLEDPNLNRTALVLPDGTVSFPLAGTVQAGGRSVDAVRTALAARLAPNFAEEPTVFVSIASLGPGPVSAAVAVPAAPLTVDVYIMGEVAAPGKFPVEPGTTILQLLAEAGGLTKFAAAKRIELRRADDKTGDMRRYRFDYKGTGRTPSIKGSTALKAGDVVVVPQRRLFE